MWPLYSSIFLMYLFLYLLFSKQFFISLHIILLEEDVIPIPYFLIGKFKTSLCEYNIGTTFYKTDSNNDEEFIDKQYDAFLINSLKFFLESET